jgi:hypothetical protein
MEMGCGLIWNCACALYYGICVLLLSITSIALYRLFFHPLSRVPGPKLAAVSNIWHAYHARNGYMFDLGCTLHQKYGEVVRVGPNELWFNSMEAFDKIYSTFKSFRVEYIDIWKLTILKGSTKGFEKSDFYCMLMY